MLKKRVIFTLLYNNGFFVLSRNFRLQIVGNIEWLQRNYDFSKIALSIDELIVLDVSRESRQQEKFCNHIKLLTAGCFVPISAGGGVRTLKHARELLRSGADKIVVNTILFDDSDVIRKIASEYGSQCIIASIDAKFHENGYGVWVDNGSRQLDMPLISWIEYLLSLPIGEIYINSMDRDGTGQGYDLALLENFPETVRVPVILAGGAGQYAHFAKVLSDNRVDAVATAHLFNFLGDSLEKARQKLIEENFDLAVWNTEDLGLIKG